MKLPLRGSHKKTIWHWNTNDINTFLWCALSTKRTGENCFFFQSAKEKIMIWIYQSDERMIPNHTFKSTSILFMSHSVGEKLWQYHMLPRLSRICSWIIFLKLVKRFETAPCTPKSCLEFLFWEYFKNKIYNSNPWFVRKAKENIRCEIHDIHPSPQSTTCSAKYNGVFPTKHANKCEIINSISPTINLTWHYLCFG